MMALPWRCRGRCVVVGLATLLAALPAAAQTPLTLDDVRRLPSTPWFGITPDGARVAYLLADPGAQADLWLVATAGGAPQRLTRDIGIRSVVGWNASGDRIAFVAAESDSAALWLVQPGTAPRITCRLPRGARSASWLADGQRLSFAVGTAGESIFLCDARTRETRQVTAKGYIGLEFAWAPSGDRIAVSAQGRPGFYEALESDLFLVDARTGAETPLVTRPGVDRSPVWSPDGSQIAFVSGFGRSGLLPNLGIAVIRPGDPAPRDIGTSHDRGGFFEGPFLHAWSSDGREIYYSVIDGLESPLFRLSANGGPFARIVPVEFARYPGEGHSLRQPRAQNESFDRLFQWLEHWMAAGRPDHAGDSAGAPAPTAPADDVTTLDGIIAAYYP
jgi:dipeptidyl aminopeptidase/acylaminoacyl peptidase